ncbi:hypothetical protein [Aliivibrio fischeri]|uniref:hypothetical protein n=1 Tax=Aliivibrio fischeri TaxID=668 RepID=UPI00080E2C97|nr:hypothetical protein [Aliivibrio fischeri]OCH01849.1 hypothetical protein A6E10_18375 [Aliivibrio fischeri]
MKSCWQKLNTSLLEKEKLDSHQKYQLLLSPYDIPNACRHGDSENHRSYFIEFMYIPVEERIKLEHYNLGDQVDFEVGENTGRVYKIIFNNTCVQPHKKVCKSQIEKAFTSFLERKPKLSQDKYKATKAATLHCINSFSG